MDLDCFKIKRIEEVGTMRVILGMMWIVGLLLAMAETNTIDQQILVSLTGIGLLAIASLLMNKFN